MSKDAHSSIDVCVVGSSLMDLVTYASRFPAPGETMRGSKYEVGFGGKGANQAVMSAKLGSRVLMVTRLGPVGEGNGDGFAENFRTLGVDMRFVKRDPEHTTGVATILVDETSGENAIVIVPGANDAMNVEDDLEPAREAITKHSKLVVCQLEISIDVTIATLRVASESGVRTILNPAPAPTTPLPDEIYKFVDIFCPNETETALLTGMPVGSVDEAKTAAAHLFARGVREAVIITLGEKGALLTQKDSDDEGAFVYDLIGTTKVTPVDTTGAGDSFIGSLSHFLARGCDLRDAVRRANVIAAVSVTGRGTQKSFPTADDERLRAAFDGL